MDRVEKLKEFLSSNPGDSFVAYALALEYVKVGRDEEARKIWEELLKRDPGYVGTYYHLGKLVERKGERENAIQWYERGMEEARKAGDLKTLSELRSAAEMIEE